MKCPVPQCSILEPQLFLFYPNDLKNISPILDPIKFADDTNLFFSNSDVQNWISTVNQKLASIKQRFTSNKLSLNVKKKFLDDILLRLQKLTINSHVIVRQEVIKFLGILLYENLKWKEYIK